MSTTEKNRGLLLLIGLELIMLAMLSIPSPLDPGNSRFPDSKPRPGYAPLDTDTTHVELRFRQWTPQEYVQLAFDGNYISVEDSGLWLMLTFHDSVLTREGNMPPRQAGRAIARIITGEYRKVYNQLDSCRRQNSDPVDIPESMIARKR